MVMVMDWYSIFRNQKQDEVIDINQLKECKHSFSIFPNIIHDICRLPQNIEIVKYLVSELGVGILYRVLKKTGHTPIFVAASNGCLEICKYIHEKTGQYKTIQDQVTPLHIASFSGHIEICDFFLKNKIYSISERDSDGWTPLHYAVQCDKNLSLVKFLVEMWNADINALNYSFHSSVLYISSQVNKNFEIVEYLCKLGADVNHANKHLWAPLHIASKNGNIDVCRVLLCYGADINAKTFNGCTPLYLSGSLETCMFLGNGYCADLENDDSGDGDGIRGKKKILPIWKTSFFEHYKSVQDKWKSLSMLLLLF